MKLSAVNISDNISVYDHCTAQRYYVRNDMIGHYYVILTSKFF